MNYPYCNRAEKVCDGVRATTRESIYDAAAGHGDWRAYQALHRKAAEGRMDQCRLCKTGLPGCPMCGGYGYAFTRTDTQRITDAIGAVFRAAANNQQQQPGAAVA